MFGILINSLHPTSFTCLNVCCPQILHLYPFLPSAHSHVRRYISSAIMLLRSAFKLQDRFEELGVVETRPRNVKGTIPRLPAKLRPTPIPFNPNHPPAAFPSLPLTGQQPNRSTINTAVDLLEDPPSTTSPRQETSDESVAQESEQHEVLFPRPPAAFPLEDRIDIPDAYPMDILDTDSLFATTTHPYVMNDDVEAEVRGSLFRLLSLN